MRVARLVQTRLDGDVACLTLAGAAGNALTAAMRAAVEEALRAALDDTAVRALVLQGAGTSFCAGTDIAEHDGPPRKPSLRDLCALIEEAPKPVICALHGAVIGGGVELALAAHGRVAQRGTRLAMPEIRHAMIPGAGATQRLPRLLGAQGAAIFLLGGQGMTAEDARLRPLFHLVCPGAPTDPAVAQARTLAEAGRWTRTRDAQRGLSDPGGYAAAIAALRAQVPAGPGAAQDLLRAIEVAQLFPFAQGIAFEAALYEERLAAPDCQAARHVLRCERRAARPAAAADAAPVTRVALTGAGPAACRLAALFLRTGIEPYLIPSPGQAPDALRAAVAQHLPAGSSEADRAASLFRLRLDPAPEALACAGLVLDSGAPEPDVPVALVPEVIWACLAPGGTPGRAGSTVAAGRVLAVRLHPPIAPGGVGEVTVHAQTDRRAVAGLQACLGAGDLRLIRTALRAGAVGHRLRMALRSAACLLVAHGADPYAVDAAARALGFADGPFRAMDAEGLDTARPAIAAFVRSRDLAEAGTGLLQALCDKGRTGAKAGRGIYVHGQGGAVRDPALAGVRDEVALGREAAGMGPPELCAGLLGALVNEAARLLDEGAVAWAGDLDLLALRALGFARATGGPLLQADMRGLLSLARAMRGMGALSPLWVPQARIAAMVRNGDGFFGRSPAAAAPR